MGRHITIVYAHTMEGLEGTVLFAYDDAISPPRPAKPGDKIRGTLTIGTGHVGRDVYIGQTITRARNDELYMNDLMKSEANVERLVKVALNDGQFAALVDLDFNAGAEAFATSTVLRDVNASRFDLVPDQMGRWNHTEINHKMVVSAGLTKRCNARIAMWLDQAPASGQYAAPAPMPRRLPAAPPAAAAASAVVVTGAVAAGVPLPYVALAIVILLMGAVVAFVLTRKRT